MTLNASDLRQLPDDQLQDLLSSLSKSQLEELQYEWSFWARPEQMEPEGAWNIWFINAGRGFGKTRAGAEWCREQVKKGKRRGAAVAATNSDIERVMVKGESGFLSICPKVDRLKNGKYVAYPEWSPTKRTLTWYECDKQGNKLTNKDGSFKRVSTIEFYSAEEPERLRGPQFEYAWGDELAAWNKDQDTWDMLQFCLRLGKHPRVLVTTTPKPTKLVRTILKDPKTYVTSGSTFDNADNLADTYLEAVRTQYEGTRLGRQELYAEVMEEAEGALWSVDMIDKCQIDREDVPELNRIVVALDPAMTSNKESDMTGIIVAGVDVNGHAYILGDYTERATPQGWASKAIKLYHEKFADRIVAEGNQGGDLVRTTIQTEDETVPVRIVKASRGKYARAEPISALYERGLVHHVRNPEDGANLNELETQMTTWEPLGSIGSPDRLDALVWALTELMLHGRQTPSLRLSYADGNSLQKAS